MNFRMNEGRMTSISCVDEPFDNILAPLHALRSVDDAVGGTSLITPKVQNVFHLFR